MADLDVRALAQLLEESEGDAAANAREQDEEDELRRFERGAPHVGPQVAKVVGDEEAHFETVVRSKRTRDPWAIWDEEEASGAATALAEEENDGRARPEVDISYLERRSAEDTFLGLDEKEPGTVGAAAAVFKVRLPGTQSASQIVLDVNAKRLLCQTPRFKLFLHMPLPVDAARATAQWFEKDATLAVTVPIVRE
jgi:hypothetical protein